MVSTHVIESLQFEVDFESEAHAFEEQARLTVFAQGRAQQIIGEVFDAQSHLGKVRRFETLTLELGEVFGTDLEAQWESRLRERLTEALLDTQLAGSATDSTNSNARAAPISKGEDETPHASSRSDVQLEILLHFLRRGHLPWFAPDVRKAPANHLALDLLAHDVLHDSAAALKAAWRDSPDAGAMVRRAVKQLPVRWLASLIALELTDVEQQAVQAAIDTANLWASGRSVVSLNQRWEFTLHYFLLQPASAFSLQAFLNSLLLQRSAHENKSEASVLRDLGAVWRVDEAPGERPSSPHAQVQAWLHARQRAVWQYIPEAEVPTSPTLVTPPISPTSLLPIDEHVQVLKSNLGSDSASAFNTGAGALTSAESQSFRLSVPRPVAVQRARLSVAPTNSTLKGVANQEPGVTPSSGSIEAVGAMNGVNSVHENQPVQTVLENLNPTWPVSELRLAESAKTEKHVEPHGSDRANRADRADGTTSTLPQVQTWLQKPLQHMDQHGVLGLLGYATPAVPEASPQRHKPLQQSDLLVNTSLIAANLTSARANAKTKAARRWLIHTLALQRARLAAALAAGTLEGVTAAWLLALTYDAAWLQGVLVQVGRSLVWRRDTAGRWSDDALMQLMGLWLAPSDRPLVLAFVHGGMIAAIPDITAIPAIPVLTTQPDLRAATEHTPQSGHPLTTSALPATQSLQGAATHQVRTRWTHTLGYVFQLEPNVGFNLSACAYSVLMQETSEKNLAPLSFKAIALAVLTGMGLPATTVAKSLFVPTRTSMRLLHQLLRNLAGTHPAKHLDPAALALRSAINPALQIDPAAQYTFAQAGTLDADPTWLNDLQQAAMSCEPTAWPLAAHRLAAKLFTRLVAALVTPDQQAFMVLLIKAQDSGNPDLQRHLWARTLHHVLTLSASGFDPVAYALALRSHVNTDHTDQTDYTAPTMAIPTSPGGLALTEFTLIDELQTALLSGLKAHQIEAFSQVKNAVGDFTPVNTPEQARARSLTLWTQLLQGTLHIASYLPAVADKTISYPSLTGLPLHMSNTVHTVQEALQQPTQACLTILARLRQDSGAQIVDVLTAAAMGGDHATFHAQFDRLLDSAHAADGHALRHALESPYAADRLAALCAPYQLVRLLIWWRPAEQAVLQQTLTLVHAACRKISMPVTADVLTRMQWRFILRDLFEENRPFETTGFVQRLTQYLIAALKPPDVPHWQAALTAAVTSLQILPEPTSARAADVIASTGALTRTSLTLPLATADALDGGEAIYIANAGMVLAGPYLERLFTMLGLSQDSAFVNADAAERAVHLLQYLVTGATTTPEPELVLNKILCGLPLNTPIARSITVTEEERNAIDGLLQAMIAHWKIIGSTSIAGLRESFLQREGCITCQDDAWQLQVEPRAFDMLLDQLPWGYRLLKFPWMERRLHVN